MNEDNGKEVLAEGRSDGNSSVKKYITLVLAIALLALPVLAFAAAVPLTAFEPEVFRDAVVAELKLSETDVQADTAALAGIKVLNLSSKSIIGIKGLEYLTGLEELDLSKNRIQDLSGLSGLTGLKRLNLSDNALEHIGFLKNLTALESLDISANRYKVGKERKGIQDIGALANLTMLRRLNLSGNYITELSPLAGLTGLEVLDVSNNVRLIDDEDQRLTGEKLSDLSALQRLTRLTELDISDNAISETGPLAGLKSLRRLDASNNRIADLDVIDTLGIGYADLSGNPAMKSIDDALATLPQTGDEMMLLLWAVLMLMSVAGLSVVSRRKRSEKRI